MVIPRRSLPLLFLLLATLLPAAAQTAEETFERGNEAYMAGDWASAAAAYRTVLNYRVRDARVHYNLGNAEFRLGRLGPAVLHYEKAYLLDPADREIQGNLRFVQGFRFDRVELEEPFVLLRALQRVQALLGTGGQAWIVIALFWSACALLAWGLSRRGRFGPGHGWLLATMFTLLLLAALSWWDTHGRFERRQLAVVLAPAADIVAGPGPSNPSLLTVHEGLTVEVLDSRDDWLQVSLPNGIRGWVRERAVGRV